MDKTDYKAKIIKVDVDGEITEVLKFGEGEKPCVLIAGMALLDSVINGEDIADAYKLFCKDYTVYLFFRKKEFGEGYTVEEMAKDVKNVLDKLGIKNSYMIGYSQGGMIAECISAEYPEYVKKLVIGSSCYKCPKKSKKLIYSWIDLSIKGEKGALIKSCNEYMYSDKTEGELKDYTELLNKLVENRNLNKFRVLCKACIDFNYESKLKNIKCPVFVIGVKGDRVLIGKSSVKMAKKLKCKLYMYGKEYGHTVYDFAPDYKQRIIDFFNE